jgi:hypothetical protein
MGTKVWGGARTMEDKYRELIHRMIDRLKGEKILERVFLFLEYLLDREEGS